ncbi:hypothetical protein CCHL11_07101 [Colletotrichum chlorophyti]|uniref:DUF7730 domain-containing protein n=1 Tax=Colletotrichum chlorophyti TaxID=708187 RepID=A0A1Q8S3M4_9PEZI|nr:hypothetical protein CCHL11_07101 [Colletotrichum chlorophyti]
MSPILENIHPSLRIRAPTAEEVHTDISNNIPSDNENSDDEIEDDNGARSDLDGPGALFVQDDENKQQAEADQQQPALAHFPFDRLATSVQANVIKFVLFHENHLVHCISRLDPHVPPEEPAQSTIRRSGLLHRFHLSGQSCNITYALKPNKHLALLLTCKKWYYLGVHAFYGLNTFAFSSLGEFGRFVAGIGPARRQRIQHIEILWIGSQCRTQKPVVEGRNKKLRLVSKRTWDCSWLCEMPRLKSLVIHINETGSKYMRRKYEPWDCKNYMSFITAGQPNFRFSRQLRTLQGLDFIHQLRGMELIQFYDFEVHLKYGVRQPIRDWSFFMDIENVTAMPKSEEKAEAARLVNLTPVLTSYRPSEECFTAIEPFYRESTAYDSEHVSSRAPSVGEVFNEISQEDADGDIQMLSDVEMSDIDVDDEESVENAAPPDAATSKRKNSSGKKASTKMVRGWEESLDISDDDEADYDSDATEKATFRNTRSGSVDPDSFSIADNGTPSRDDDNVSLAGSSAENPIMLDHYEPVKPGTRLYKLQMEVKDEPSEVCSEAGRASVVSSHGRSSVSSGSSGLFVRSPVQSPPSRQRHGQELLHYEPYQERKRSETSMTETLRKRGFEMDEIRNAIDLSLDDSASSVTQPHAPSISTSLQTDHCRMIVRAFDNGSGSGSTGFNHRGTAPRPPMPLYQPHSFPRLNALAAREDSKDDEDNVFGRKRQKTK